MRCGALIDVISILVVEPSAIRGLAADCPIFAIFIHSHLPIFHSYVVVSKALRGFQQFNEFITPMLP